MQYSKICFHHIIKQVNTLTFFSVSNLQNISFTLSETLYSSFIHSFIHSFIGMCRMRQFLAVLMRFFHFSLLCTFSLHPIPLASLQSFFTSSCHLFLGPPLSLVVSKFIYNTFLGSLFFSILCTCPNQCNYLQAVSYVSQFHIKLHSCEYTQQKPHSNKMMHEGDKTLQFLSQIICMKCSEALKNYSQA